MLTMEGFETQTQTVQGWEYAGRRLCLKQSYLLYRNDGSRFLMTVFGRADDGAPIFFDPLDDEVDGVFPKRTFDPAKYSFDPIA